MTYRNGDLSGIGSVADRCTAGIRRIRAPRYVIRDRDSVCGALVRARIKAMGIEEVVTAVLCQNLIYGRIGKLDCTPTIDGIKTW